MAHMPLKQRKVVGKANHAMNLMTSLEKMKKKDFLCDFTIKVGSWSFPVHRTVLAACSGYFEAMFSSDMKEVREGFVDMKGIDPMAIGRCVEYMYCGEIVLTIEEVENVLHASNLIQVEDLTDRCLKFLKSNLSPDNCLLTINMSRLSGRKDVEEKAIEFTNKNFDTVISTEMFPFVSAADLTHYLTNCSCNYAVLWKAIMTWLAYNGENSPESFEQVVSLVNADMFPFDFLFNTALDELAMNDCNRGVELVLENIFCSSRALDTNLNLDNCFLLHQLNSSRRNMSGMVSANKAIIKFFAKNLANVVEKEEFLRLKKEDVLGVLRSSVKYENNHQDTIWKAIKKWVENTKTRRNDFSELFQALKLEDLPCDFIRKCLLPDGLVGSSRLSSIQILDTISRRVSHIDDEGRYKVPCIAMIDNDNGTIKTLEVQCKNWMTSQQCPGEESRRIAFANRNLLVLGEKLFKLEPDNSWRGAASRKRQPCPWCQLTSYRGGLYVVEGKYMARYDPKADEWTENLPGCSLVMGFFVASDDKWIYAMGGHSAKKYDSMTQTWSPIAPMRIQRYDAAAATLNSLLYVMGGTQFGKLFKSVECYSPQSDSWTDIVSMREPRSHFSACVVSNKLYAVGGAKRAEGCDGSASDSVEVYDPQMGRWEIVTQMKTTGSRTLASFYELDVTDIIVELATSLSTMS